MAGNTAWPSRRDFGIPPLRAQFKTAQPRIVVSEFWTRKSQEWEGERQTVDAARFERDSVRRDQKGRHEIMGSDVEV
jgi:hypothetical protein